MGKERKRNGGERELESEWTRQERMRNNGVPACRAKQVGEYGR
jgi:hypothetical protein